MRRHIRRPSAALVVACVALFVALSGTSLATVAQSVLPANSVGEVQLRDSAVTSAKVADETLQIVDFSPRARAALTGPGGPAGPAGAAGPAGPSGPQGGPGISGLEVVEVSSASNDNNLKNVRASFRSGRRVLGGGGWVTSLIFTDMQAAPFALRGSRPERRSALVRRDGWRAVAVETAGFIGNWRLTAYAVCAFVD